MNLLHPLLLWLLPLAVGLPILAHLYLRVRTRPVVLPSVMFFLKIDPRMQARRRLREYLLLALRILFLVLVVLALARPVSTGWGPQARRTAVLVIDSSQSMGRVAESGEALIDRARLCAHAIVDGLGDGDAAAVLATAADPALAARLAALAEPAVLHQLIDSVEASDAAGALGETLQQATALLQSGATAERELHLITDLQANEWAHPAVETLRLEGVRIVVHSLAVDAAAPPPPTLAPPRLAPGRVLAGRPHPVRVAVDGEPNGSLELAVRGSDGSDGLHRLILDELGHGELSLSVVAPEAGLHWLRVGLADAAGSAATTLAYRALPRQWVELRGDFPLFQLALAPAGDGRLSGLVPRAERADAAIAGEPAAVVAPIAVLADAASSLHAWLQQGGVVIALPGSGEVPSLPAYGLQVETARAHDPPRTVMPGDAAAAALPALSDEAGLVTIPGWRIARHHSLRGGDWEILFATDDGSPLIVQRQVGAGRLVVWGCDFATAWTNLPLKGYALALAQGLILGPGGEQRSVQDLIAGARPAAATSTALLRLDAIAGGSLSWRGRAEQLPRLVRSGVYRLDDGQESQLVAINPDPDERTAEQVDPEQVPALGELPHLGMAFHSPERSRAQLDELRSGGDLATPLALLALLVLLVESWVGAWRGIARKRQEDAHRSELATALTGAAPAVLWHPGLGPGASAAVAVVVALGLWWLWTRLRERCDRRHTGLLIGIKLAVAALLLLIVADPHLRRETREAPSGSVLALLDVSSSMDVVDDGRSSRLQRALARVEQLREALPDGLTVELRPIDRRIGEPLEAAPEPASGLRHGDLSSALSQLDSVAGGARATLLLSDGGDETPRLKRTPQAPLHVIGIGSTALPWADLAVAGVEAPPSAERAVAFTVRGELRARQGELADAQLAELPVVVERQTGEDAWTPLAEQTVDLRGGRAHPEFELREEEVGHHRYRLRLPSVPGELTEANNQRGFTVEIAAERLQVLYYAERLGLGYKYLRAELGRDPGIQFTALLRIQGNRYQLTGDEDPNTQPLRDGFPTDPALLEPFQVIVLAAAPDSAWSAEAQQALAQRVRRGAALVWFDSGEALQGNAYRESALDALRPWQVGPSATARRGDYRLAVPAAAATHPLLDGVGETLRDAAIASLVTGLQPRPDATVLAEASAEDRSHPILAWRAVDEGQVLGVASDTLWRLARGSPEQRSAYGTLWRQAVRSLAGRDERLGQLRLRWDRERYRPGDEALLTVQVLETDPGMQRSLTASLRPPGSDELQSLAVKPAPIGDGYLVRVPLALSGEHALELELAMGDGRRERHTAVVDVASRLAEGARLEVDHQALDRLALAGEGRYVREDDTVAWRALVESLAAGETVRSDHPLISGRWWPLLVICALLLGEWLLRRRLGLS